MREAREKERELRELDRDIRTVFAYNLPLKADERDLFEFFSGAGTVEDVRIIMDRNTRRSKGFAYIEYGNRVRVHVRACSHTPWDSPCMHACMHALRSLLCRMYLSYRAVVHARTQHPCCCCDSACRSFMHVMKGLCAASAGGHSERTGADGADLHGPSHHGQEL